MMVVLSFAQFLTPTIDFQNRWAQVIAFSPYIILLYRITHHQHTALPKCRDDRG